MAAAELHDSTDVLELIYDLLLVESYARKRNGYTTQFTLRQQGSVITLSTGDPEWEITVRRTRA